MVEKRTLRYQTDARGVIDRLQGGTWLTLQRGAPASNWAFSFENEHDFWAGWGAGVTVAVVGAGGAQSFRLHGSAGARTH